jgi:hypothetical protein
MTAGGSLVRSGGKSEVYEIPRRFCSLPSRFVAVDTKTIGRLIKFGRKTFEITVAGVSAPNEMS